jgi:nucleotide-binding universal stress UspA family protein
MSYKTILVHVDTDKRSTSRVDLAAGIALSWGAHLVGVHFDSMPRIPNHVLGRIGAEFVDDMRRHQQMKVDRLRQEFDGAMRRHGLVGSEWRAPTGDPEQQAALHARYADLVIVGQQNPVSLLKSATGVTRIAVVRNMLFWRSSLLPTVNHAPI